MTTDMRSAFIEKVISYYGPTAFGVISLLIIWYTIASPQIERNRVDREALVAVSNSMRETAMVLQQTAKSLEASSHYFDAAVKRLEAVNGGR